MAPSIICHFVREIKHLQSSEIINRSDYPPPPSLGDYVTHRRLTIKNAIYISLWSVHINCIEDLAGKFITPSLSENNYILIAYNYDNNYIHLKPLANRTKGCHLLAYQKYILLSQSHAQNLQLLTLDNEVSAILIEFMQSEDISFQSVMPCLHHRNSTERATRTFKAHFIAILVGCNPKFSIMHLDKLLAQAEITLNIVCNSRINSSLSAYAKLFSTFDFNRTPVDLKDFFFKSPIFDNRGRQE